MNTEIAGPEAPSKRTRVIALLAVGVATSVLLLVSAILICFHQNTGDPMIRPGQAEDTREAVKILLDSYSALITLITAAFGATAFLISLQKDKASAVSSRAWKLLFVGVVFLLLALSLSLVGREQIMVMMTRNAVDLNLPSLTLVRWLSYACLTLATIFVMSFAFEVASPPDDRGQT